ncbi:MAG TPA: hypothetical protein VGO98_00045 [Candidatus Saccharimonadales bacterium]|jgi:hypothetical protein|nr:hypothetical protein [Candidatus Saccharimonadales bacterium]
MKRESTTYDARRGESADKQRVQLAADFGAGTVVLAVPYGVAEQQRIT